MEMNTRLQVEHPVTEMTTGLDLVQLQVLIAAGAALPDLLADHASAPRGHSIEARVYAESPEQGYLPAAGRLTRVLEPSGPGIRVDSGVHEGCEVSVHFDPMLAKIIVHAPDRESACRKMAQALKDTVYLGIPTNVDFLARIIESPEFKAGQLSTSFLDEQPKLAQGPSESIPDIAYAAAALCRSLSPQGHSGSQGGSATSSGSTELWDDRDNLRVWGSQ